MRLSSFITLVIALLPLLTPCPLRAEQPALKIGVVSGLSGLAAKWNHYQNNGMRLAQEELAQSGQKIDLVFEDSQTTGTKVISAFNKLIDFDRVDAVIADDFGYVVAPLIPLADQRRKLLLAISLPQAEYCQGSKGYFFSITSQFVFSEPAFEKFFILHPEIKKAAIFIFDDPEWGQTYERIWRDLASRHGVEIVSFYRSIEERPDLNLALAKALPRKPDLVLLAQEPILFSKAAQLLGYKGPILSANNFLEVIAGKENIGSVIDQVYIVDPEIDADFARRYEARFKEPPILEAYAGYEALRAMAKAFALNREHPEIAMRSLKYKGLAGEIDFTGESCAGNITKWGLFKLKDYRLVPVTEQP